MQGTTHGSADSLVGPAAGPTLVIALGEVDGQAFVQPARREVVGVPKAVSKTRCVKLAGLRRPPMTHRSSWSGVIRPKSVRMSDSASPPNVLSRVPGPPRCRRTAGAVRVDEEVDGLRLGDPEERRRVADRLLRDLQLLLGERRGPLVPVHGHEVALDGPPRLRRVLVVDRQRGAEPDDTDRPRTAAQVAVNRRVGCQARRRSGPASRPGRTCRSRPAPARR